jgi:predicted NACHT family NTPase
MPERFESHVFSPRANQLMREAFEAAWPKTTLIERNRNLTRQLLASAIIDQVIAGADDPDQIAAAALATLAVARNISS